MTARFWQAGRGIGVGFLLLGVVSGVLVVGGDEPVSVRPDPHERFMRVDRGELEKGDPGHGAAELDDSSWYAAARAEIVRAERVFTLHEGGWTAPARAQGLRAKVSGAGVALTPRLEDSVQFQVRLSLLRHGRKDEMHPVKEAEVVAEGERVELTRPSIAEWMVNGPDGLRHGFTLHDAPYGDGPAVLELQIDGTLRGITRGDKTLRLEDDAGKAVMMYGNLTVTDADGLLLPAALLVEAGSLTITVEDALATYPLSIASLITTAEWMAEADQDLAFYGFRLSTAGDVNGDGYSDVAIGSWLFDELLPDEGRVFVYHGSPSGLPLDPDWTAEGGQAYSSFGYDVAVAGDVNGDGYDDLVVGASQSDNGQVDEGQAMLFTGSAAGLSATPAWTGESNQNAAYYGFAVSGAGDVNADGYDDVIIGACLFDNGQSDEGRAFLYLGSATGLSPTEAWTGEGNQDFAGYGCSLSTAGDVDSDGYDEVIVGAYLYDNIEFDEGRAFVYHGSATGLSATAGWTAEPDQSGSGFGIAVSLAGDVNGDGYGDVIIGADFYDSGQTDEGRASVYLGSATGLAATPAWFADGNQLAAYMGRAVSTAGDANGDGYADVIVGAPRWANGESLEGGAFVFLGSANGLSLTADWTGEGEQVEASYGIDVGTAGDVDGDGFSDLLIGAHLHDNGESNEGRAYLVAGSMLGPSTVADWLEDSGQASSLFGYTVASAGDVNGDGYGDVILGADWYDNGEEDEGRAFVFLGSASGLSAVADWTAESNQAFASFGSSVDGAGDVNGDGYDDVIVGSFLESRGQTEEGVAYVFHGSPAGLSLVADWIVEGAARNTELGIAVAGAGDVNGDGYADVIVGADGYKSPQANEGAAFVFHGSATGLSTVADWSAESNQVSAYFGISVDGAVDVNGDGYSDVIVGADYWENGETFEGGAFVYHGGPGGLSTAADWAAESNQARAGFGLSVSSAGDVNGDGFGDVIVGAQNYDQGHVDEGAAFVFHGSPTGLSPLADWTGEGNQNFSLFGASVASAGDVNGDGYGDVIVGANWFDNGEADEGAAFIFLGAATGLGAGSAWQAESNQVSANFGVGVAGAGDVNGDGHNDVLVGADMRDGASAIDEGTVFMYLGESGGMPRMARQLRSDRITPIALLGLSDTGDSFVVRTEGQTAFGRGFIGLEVETKPLGTPFDGTGIVVAATGIDTGTPGASGSLVTMEEEILGLTPSSAYRWRARLRGDSPYFPASRWLSPSGNGMTETDFRTIGGVDLDGDGTPSSRDCDDSNGSVWSLPGEVETVLLAADGTTLTWSVPVDPGGMPGSVLYDTIRSLAADDFMTAATCVESNDGLDESAVDAAPMAAGTIQFYLIRPENACGLGPAGWDGLGAPRSAVACP